MLAGAMEMEAAVAVPASDTVCGLPAALSAIFRIAAREADVRCAGENTTLAVQPAAAPKLGGQLLVWAKSAAFVPVMLIPLTESEAALVFSTVTI
jgi:hypothetical protein